MMELNESNVNVKPNKTSNAESDPWFLVNHATALSSLAISISVSIFTLIFVIKSGPLNIFKRKTGERLVVYLAICDLLFSAEHASNHILSLTTDGAPPFVECVVSGFVLLEFVNAQSFIVVFSAFSAFMLVTRGVKVSYGKCDWILLLVSFGIPATLGIIFAYLGKLGPFEYWCMIDMSQDGAVIVFNIYAGAMFLTAFLDVFFYAGVWLKISSTSKALSSSTSGTTFKVQGGKMVSASDQRAYNKTALILTVFVIAYFAQWWPFMTYGIWSYFAPPPVIIVELIVIFCTMGGVMNFFAYTFVRRAQAKSSEAETTKPQTSQQPA